MAEQNNNMYYDDYTVLIYGYSKSGKTMGLRNLTREKMSYINVESKPLTLTGGKRLKRYYEPDKIDSFMKAVKESVADEDIEYIVIDSITKLGDEIVYMELIKEFIDEKGKKFVMEAWLNYKDFFTGLLKYAKRSKKHFIFIGLEDQMDSSEDAFEKEACVMLQGSTKKKIVSDFTNVFRASSKIIDDKLEYTYQTRRTKEDRYVQCGSLPCLDDYEPNDLAIIFDKMKKYYEEDE
jgi:hypothetical protein